MLAAMALAAALTQDSDQWSEAVVLPIFGDGRLSGCAVNFKSVRRDNLYFEGRAVGADGSLSFYHFGGTNIGAMIKIAVLDGQALQAPDSSFLITGYATNGTDLTSNMAAEDAGYTLSTFRFGNPTADALGSIAGQSSITVGVRMSGGLAAIPFRTDLTEAQAAEWTECMSVLMEGIRQEIDAVD